MRPMLSLSPDGITRDNEPTDPSRVRLELPAEWREALVREPPLNFAALTERARHEIALSLLAGGFATSQQLTIDARSFPPIFGEIVEEQ